MVVIWSQAAPLASNQPNTFSVLNVKISIEQQQRNILNIPLIIQRKKKKNSKNIIIQLLRRNRTEHHRTHRIRTWREPALWLGWGSWNASCSLLNCSMRSQALTVLMLIVPQIILPCHHAIIYKLTSWSLPACEPSHGKNVCKSCGPVLEEESCNLRLKRRFIRRK